jgi:hypothetical protein
MSKLKAFIVQVCENFSSLGFISLIILDGLSSIRKKRTLATNFNCHQKKKKKLKNPNTFIQPKRKSHKNNNFSRKITI